jgi:cell division protein FtsB
MTRLLVAFAASALLATSIAGDNGLLALGHAREREAALAREIADLRDANDRLRRTADALKTDPRAIELIARGELGLARRDEKVVRVAAPR